VRVKRCPCCKVEKSIAEFSIRRTGRVGHASTYCKKCQAIKNRSYSQRHPEKRARIEKNSKLKRAYGITLAKYDEMFERQGGVCAICKTDKPDNWHKHFSVDHCHTTGRIRGLLCGQCNVGLGSFKDRPEFLAKAIEYLMEN
jgi:hypothetical protein